ncbi:hypothetical protein FRC05_006779 [Tulasnella sp. 425]|nr:hypothetical protein FRC05_006779 [Tulasnella sp. 425]
MIQPFLNYQPNKSLNRPGDIARIEESSTSQRTGKKKGPSTEGSGSAKAVEGVIYKITDTRAILAVDQAKDSTSDDIDLPEKCRLVKLANTVTYDRMDKAIDNLEKVLQLSPPEPSLSTDVAAPSRERRDNITLNPLIEVLVGKRRPGQPIPLPDLQFMDPGLNPSQQEAVRFALEAPEIALIHGPPGTGKTHTLVEIIRQLVGQEKKVLVCGASNLAVDNLLERLIPHGIPVTRLGHPARVLGSLQSSTLDTQAAASDESQLAKDVKAEMEAVMNTLAGKGKGKKPRGAERKKMWDEVKELRKEYRKREGVVVKSVMSRAKVVLATCHSSGGRQLLNTQFDVLVIDEATQAMEAVCWIPIFKSKKLILAGDPMQLPPTILSTDKEKQKKAGKAASAPTAKDKKPSSSKSKSKSSQPSKTVEPKDDTPKALEPEDTDGLSADEGMIDDPSPLPIPSKGVTLRIPESLETTLFDRLEGMYGVWIKRMLTVQYRMHASICEFPSETLYASRLTCHESVAGHLLRDLPGVNNEPDFMDVVSLPVVFFDTAGCEYFERLETNEEGGGGDEGSRRNENEAMVVKQWVEKLVEAGVQPHQIALITPYQAQVAHLVSLLRPSMPELEIGTVDGMQGREKEAVILSLVRSNDKGARSRVLKGKAKIKRRHDPSATPLVCNWRLFNGLKWQRLPQEVDEMAGG